MDWRKGIKEISVDGEWLSIKKGFFGYSVVYPIKNYNGTINWKNLITGGSWFRLLFIIIFVLICIGAIWEVQNLIEVANKCANTDPIFILR